VIVFLKLLSIIYMGMGLIFFLKPGYLKDYIQFWKERKRIKLACTILIPFMAILFIGAPQCRLPWVLITLAALVQIKLIFLLYMGQEKIDSMLSWWEKQPPNTFRLMGLVALGIGALWFYAV